MLTGKSIVLGVTGGIAVYKAADLARKLTQAGATVDVIMTSAATKFVTPLTFQTLTRRPVITEMFQLLSSMEIAHVSLAERADVILIAPATANCIGKIANGICDDMLSTTVLASRAPLIVAPAMDLYMYDNPATQENLEQLRKRGVFIVEPGSGPLASGLVGKGRLADTDAIIASVHMVVGRHGPLAKRRIVVTAGGTQEPLDPVRYITNRSSGKMGYAVACEARDRGAAVTLISAPTALERPRGMEFVSVTTAQEMRQAVVKAVVGADALIMVAAVADFRPETEAAQKIKKGDQDLMLKLTRNPDIIAEVSGADLVKIGFAAESHDLLRNAAIKVTSKGADMIVANTIVGPEGAFGAEASRVWFLFPDGRREHLPLLPKTEVAARILDELPRLLASRSLTQSGQVAPDHP